ncbi:unnamed protein product, partial [Didymodactylos carnosus]
PDVYPNKHNLDLSTLIPSRPSHLKPIYVTILVRHGHRTPIIPLPNQSRSEFHSVWGDCHNLKNELRPCDIGDLTPLGEYQMFIVGQHIRQQYVNKDHLLPITFNKNADTLMLRSTFRPRTKLSLYRLVQGLYPDENLQTISQH